jgi:hypothetical protein
LDIDIQPGQWKLSGGLQTPAALDWVSRLTTFGRSIIKTKCASSGGLETQHPERNLPIRFTLIE